jgi:hypothetical protein
LKNYAAHVLQIAKTSRMREFRRKIAFRFSDMTDLKSFVQKYWMDRTRMHGRMRKTSGKSRRVNNPSSDGAAEMTALAE